MLIESFIATLMCARMYDGEELEKFYSVVMTVISMNQAQAYTMLTSDEARKSTWKRYRYGWGFVTKSISYISDSKKFERDWDLQVVRDAQRKRIDSTLVTDGYDSEELVNFHTTGHSTRRYLQNTQYEEGILLGKGVCTPLNQLGLEQRSEYTFMF